jgi:hypothetical protein
MDHYALIRRWLKLADDALEKTFQKTTISHRRPSSLSTGVSRSVTTQCLLDLPLKLSMYMNDDVTWEQFALKFREAFGRDMTPDEHHWFQSIWTIVNRRKQAKAEAAAA